MVTIGRGGGGSQQECPGFKSTGLLGPFGGNKGKKNWLKNLFIYGITEGV